MIESTITSRGQTTLPNGVWKALRVKPGGRVRCILLGSEVRILPSWPIGRLIGVLKHDGAPGTNPLYTLDRKAVRLENVVRPEPGAG